MKILRGDFAFLFLGFVVAAASALSSAPMLAQERVAPVDKTQTPTIDPVPQAAPADAPAETGQAGDSHIRIVRLSEVQGEVTMDRKTGRGLEATMQNMPVGEGARLETGEGLAEIEFEDQSTLRVTPHTLVEFPLLVLRSSGAKATTVKVLKGVAYVSLENTKGNEFTLQTGAQSMTMAPSTHLRVEVKGTRMTLAVIKGEAQVQTLSALNTDAANSVLIVGKKKTLTLDSSKPQPVELAKGLDESPYDEWDRNAIDYHNRYGKGNALVGSSGYGISDLNYYGSFSNVAGCGTIWQPYLVSAAWNPYANGVWAWYPAAGYSWVSPYPWGWTPYHTGSWSYCPSRGWGWQPGGGWNGLNNLTASAPQAINPGRTPLAGSLQPVGAGGVRPPRPPVAGRSTLVVTNGAPLAYSKLNEAKGSFEFRRDSAGLGVPRGTLGNLNHVSHGVEQHGLVTRPVYVDRPQTVGTAEGGAGQVVRTGPATIRPGSPPMRDNASSVSGGYAPRGGDNNAGGGYRPNGGGNAGGYSPSSGGGNAGGGYHSSGGGSPSMSSAPSASAAPAGGGGGQVRSGK